MSKAGRPTRVAPAVIQGPPFRIGHGYDLHRLKRGGRLMLGGVKVAEGISPVAHSDGDVVLHAIVDALLGAMGWGDIGQWFPNTDAKWKNMDSQLFVRTVFDRVRRERWRVGNLDLTVLAERPKLKDVRCEIVGTIESMLECAGEGRVNLKAGTNEKCDAIGCGKAIAAHAVVLLVRDS